MFFKVIQIFEKCFAYNKELWKPRGQKIINYKEDFIKYINLNIFDYVKYPVKLGYNELCYNNELCHFRQNVYYRPSSNLVSSHPIAANTKMAFSNYISGILF